LRLADHLKSQAVVSHSADGHEIYGASLQHIRQAFDAPKQLSEELAALALFLVAFTRQRNLHCQNIFRPDAQIGPHHGGKAADQ